MKPDYGAYLHTQHMSPDTELLFYDVPVSHVSMTDVPGLTTMLNKLENGVEYAVSFDFEKEAAAHLIAKLLDCEERLHIEQGGNPVVPLKTALERAAVATTVRGRTVTFEPPLIVKLDARLGPLQRSSTEVFAPLLVHSVA